MMGKTKAEILAEEKQIEAETRKIFERIRRAKECKEAAHLVRKKKPYKELCHECKSCFFNKEKDEWDCKAFAHDLFEHSCCGFESKESE